MYNAQMRRLHFVRAFVVVASLAVVAAAMPQSNGAGELEQKVERFVRRLFALGPSFEVRAGAPAPSPVEGFQQVPVEVVAGGQVNELVFYVSRDGRHIFRGELFELAADPFAATRDRLSLAGAPSKGPADARVVVVEFSDFECPTCRMLHNALRQIVARYPQVRFVFKDYPLEQIHPWAMTAHIAGRCALAQSNDAFWKLHDLIYDNQESITPASAWQTMLDYAGRAGLDAAAFRACMTSEPPKQAVAASVAEGQELRVANTPTVFVNGRRIVGGDPNLIVQYIEYELAAAGQPTGQSSGAPAGRTQPGTSRPQPGAARPRP
jgi:protein-disulfide isomerase